MINKRIITSTLVVFLMLLFNNIYSQTTWQWGTYTGDGLDDRQISVSFQPDFVIVRQDGTNYNAFARTKDMAADNTFNTCGTGGNPRTDHIQSFNSSGFVVGTGTNVNNNGTKYYFHAYKADADLEIGTYTGNGGGQRDIPLSGAFRPKLVYIVPASGSVTRIQMETTSSEFKSETFTGTSSTTISSSYASGFTIASTYNTNAVVYYYAAFKSVSGSLETGSYVGDGAASKVITGLTFQPKYLIVLSFGGYPYFRANDMVTDYSVAFYASGGTLTTTGIRSMSSDRFTVGNSTFVNNSGTTYYYASMGGSKGTLPIQLLSFNAMCEDNGNKININWTTATETNNDYFTVEYSLDGIYYTPIAKTKGAGNSIEKKEYTYTDNDPAKDKTAYYRIKQTDFDGRSETFNPLVVNCSKADTLEVKIHSNPVKNILEFDFECKAEQVLNYEISDIYGKIVNTGTLEAKKGSNQFRVDVSKINKGVYLLIINCSKHKSKTKFQKS